MKRPRKPIPPFNHEQLEAICKVIADTSSGLTGPEIGHTLAKCGIPDVDSTNTKWKRLYNAFLAIENRVQHGNHVVAFVHKAMSPVRHADSGECFEEKRAELNRVLAFSGLTLGEDGRIAKVKAAKTISEAQERADRLRSTLQARGVHQDVLRFCRAELLQKNYFHAVLEAAKSVADKIRAKSGLTSDGADLAQGAFALGKTGKPVLAINPLSTETERGEQRGFTNLLIGLFGTFRNPPAHAPKIYWPINEQDALDILSLVSLVHRKLDNVRKP
jgi:uncharacterized protein (TIGR02391 family)